MARFVVCEAGCPADIEEQRRVVVEVTGKFILEIAHLLRDAAGLIEEGRVAITSEDSVWIDDFLECVEEWACDLSRVALTTYLDAEVALPSEEQ